ncbi:MAG TPA: molybdopterin-dependent oxidoreductase [Nitriliruptorales bacterium]|nr:molybdopterin-dependent oxidoreductase [Nitriliruptorales bacterium]
MRSRSPSRWSAPATGRARLRPRAVSQPWLHEAVGTARWTGVPLADVLGEAGLDDRVVEVVFTGADRGVEGGIEQHYQRSLAVEDATRADVLLAYELNGQPLPPQHGAPVRLVVPGWYGMASVKWLTAIDAVDTPFHGYQQATAYRLRTDPDDDGIPVQRIAVRSLMIPPGIPDFLTRRRLVRGGPCELQGRAWSGAGAITRVEVSVDGGATWHDAERGAPVGRHAWTGWRWTWKAEPGEYELCCRATDGEGRAQPLAHRWNLGGYAVNTVQRIAVTVAP